jgi:hypothetical protein
MEPPNGGVPPAKVTSPSVQPSKANDGNNLPVQNDDKVPGVVTPPAANMKFQTAVQPTVTFGATTPPKMPNEMDQLALQMAAIKDVNSTTTYLEPGLNLDELSKMGWDGTTNPSIFIYNHLQCLKMLQASVQAADNAKTVGEAADLNPVPTGQMANILNAGQYKEAFIPSPSKAAALKRKATYVAGPSVTQQELQEQLNARSSADAIADLDITYDSTESLCAAVNGNGDRPVPYGLPNVPGQKPAYLSGPPPPKRNKMNPLTSPIGNDYNPYGSELKIVAIACFDGIICIRHMKSSRMDGFNNHIRQEIRKPDSTTLGYNLQICELRDQSSGKSM